jgi:peptidoglycan hydrolase-like protein with peptidoglycan-binding domain
MRASSHQAKGKALLLGGAFLFFCSMVAVALGATPAVAQSSKTSGSAGSTAKKSTSKPTRKRTPVRRRRVRGQMAPTADRIKEIQGALAKSGHYTGEPTGKWDAASVAALKRFQEANDLKASGKLNALTLQKLGLGSETAGAAPPRKAVAAAEAGSGQ